MNVSTCPSSRYHFIHHPMQVQVEGYLSYFEFQVNIATPVETGESYLSHDYTTLLGSQVSTPERCVRHLGDN